MNMTAFQRFTSPLMKEEVIETLRLISPPAGHTDKEVSVLMNLITGGEVLAVVNWPEEAASWLRPATRFTELNPDVWVVAGALLGWAQMSRRLRHSTSWDPRRTYEVASLADERLIRCVGGQTL